ncbi:hypothetical protein [Bradyrhizobium sp. BR 1432]|uniref:hypothetical protein n=1 Tax=Bradyrhizobium sp. BR 1432 TaxID=3447966 RepID=UPI003EE62B99
MSAGCCSRARAEQTHRKPSHGPVLIQPAHRIKQTVGQQLNVEYIRAVRFFIDGQEVQQQGR